MKQTILFIIALIISSIEVYAQMGMGDQKDIKEMKSRKLIVVLQEENPYVINKLENKGHENFISTYKKMIDDYNKFLPLAFSTWPYQNDVEFKTIDEAANMAEGDKDKIAVIIVWHSFQRHDTIYYSPYFDWNYKAVVSGLYDTEDKDYFKGSTYFALMLGETFNRVMKEHRPLIGIYESRLYNIFPNQTDVLAAIYNMKFYIDYREEGKSFFQALKEVKKMSPKLANEKLLFSKNDMSSGFTKTNIKSLYHYNFDVVPDTTINRYVINKTPGYAFMVNVQGMHEIFECETGNFLGEVAPSGLSYSKYYTWGPVSGNGTIDEKIIKKLVEKIEDK